MLGRSLHGEPGVGSPQPREKLLRPAGVRHLYKRHLYSLPTKALVRGNILGRRRVLPMQQLFSNDIDTNNSSNIIVIITIIIISSSSTTTTTMTMMITIMIIMMLLIIILLTVISPHAEASSRTPRSTSRRASSTTWVSRTIVMLQYKQTTYTTRNSRTILLDNNILNDYSNALIKLYY